MSGLKGLALPMEKLPLGEKVISEKGLTVSPHTLEEWWQNPDGTYKTLHTQLKVNIEALLVCYVIVAARNPKSASHWIPVKLKDIDWKNKETFGKLKNVVKDTMEYNLLHLFILSDQLFIQPTQKCIDLMTKIGKNP
jgi:hypothetical protein